jgi:hypothetical protein
MALTKDSSKLLIKDIEASLKNISPLLQANKYEWISDEDFSKDTATPYKAAQKVATFKE